MYPDTLTAAVPGDKSEIVSSVILSTLCSKPVVINMNKHENIIISFEISSLHLKVHHTAKQTNILQNNPLKNNSEAGRLILVAEVAAINSPTGPFARPVKKNM